MAANNFKDITGQRFGRWIAKEYLGNSRWICECDCGTIKIVMGKSLRCGNSKSCGCYSREQAKKSKTIHNLSATKIHMVYATMKARCNNPHVKSYPTYGGRGISVCQEWTSDFMKFYDWSIANGYKDGLTLDRIDTNGNYEPSNCRWVDHKTQCNNKRNNILVEVDGETATLKQMADKYGVNYKLVWKRYRTYGWDIEKALFEPTN